MDPLEALLRARPQQADLLRRTFWRDPEFRSICEDYRDALMAEAQFEDLSPPEPGRAEEYHRLAAELLAEAVEIAKRASR